MALRYISLFYLNLLLHRIKRSANYVAIIHHANEDKTVSQSHPFVVN